jgi:cell division protein ZipA
MDKDILRIVIIIIGVLVIAGMLFWHYFKGQKSQRDINFYDKGEPLDNIDPSLVIDTKDDDFDIIPLGGVNDHDDSNHVVEDIGNYISDSETEFQPELKHHATEVEHVELEVPNILQFGIIADDEAGFNGKQLQQAFSKVGLKYGSNQVYERLDEYEQVDFAIASMVEPGIFPDENLDGFTCPGLVCFFQPKLVNEPLTVFDDFIETIHILALELGGTEWDQSRQPLKPDTVEIIRNLLMQENLSL